MDSIRRYGTLPGKAQEKLELGKNRYVSVSG